MILLAGLLLISGIGSAMATSEDEWPRIAPFTASYKAQALGNTLNARITLNHEDIQTRMAMDAHVSGFLRILGRFELNHEALMNIDREGLQLITSRSQQITPRRERKVETRFDWQEGIAIGHINNERFEREVPPGTLDFLGSLYHTMLHLEASDSLAPGDSLDLHTLERDRLREYHFEIAGTETVESPMGQIEAIRVLRHSDDRDVALSAWFAPSLSHLPVRFDYEADGRIFELYLIQLEWHDPIIHLTE